MSHAEYNSPTYPLFREKRILPIQELITLDTLIFMYHFHSGNVPQISKSMFINNSSIHSHNTRHKLPLHKSQVRTTHALKSFIYYWISLRRIQGNIGRDVTYIGRVEDESNIVTSSPNISLYPPKTGNPILSLLFRSPPVKWWILYLNKKSLKLSRHWE